MLRLAVVGMNNPLSDNPLYALWTDPPGCTGHRLWQLANEASGISQEDWLEATDRCNLVVGELWSVPAARLRAEELSPRLAGRTTIMLGSEVAAMFGMSGGPLTWHEREPWLWMPHPSGRNYWWNVDAHRAAAVIALREVLQLMAPG